MYDPQSNPILFIVETFNQAGMTIGEVVLGLLRSNHPSVESILKNLENILDTLKEHNESTQQVVDCWSLKHLQEEMCKLTLKETGFHFSAKTTTESKLKDFDIQSMSNKVRSLAPGLCVVFDALLEANPALSYKRNWARQKAETSGLSRRQRKTAKTTDGDIDMHDVTRKTSENIVDDDGYWKLFDQEEISLIDNEDDKPEGIEEVIEEQQLKLKTIVRSFISINTN